MERTIFILSWISSVSMQRRTQMGLNKGESHHALKRALNFNRSDLVLVFWTQNVSK
jgi:TnpA family transposase